MKGAVVMDYTGICAACFEPIEGEPFRFRPKGRKFHKACAQKEGNYYVRLEMRLAEVEVLHRDFEAKRKRKGIK